MQELKMLLQEQSSIHFNPQRFSYLEPPDELGFIRQIILSQESQYHNWSSSSSYNNSPPPACLLKVAFPPLKKACKKILALKGLFGQAAQKKLTQFLCKDKVSNLLQFVFALSQINKKVKEFLYEFFETIKQIVNKQKKLGKKQLLQKIIVIIQQSCNQKGHTGSNSDIVKELWSLAKRDRKAKESNNPPFKEKRKRISKDIEYRNINTRSSRGPQLDLQRFNQRKQNGQKLSKEINRRQRFDEIDVEQIRENVRIAFAKISHLPIAE